MEIVVINGPNLNVLDMREKSFYGGFSLEEIKKEMLDEATKNNISLDFFQSNSESQIIEKIHSLADKKDVAGLIINAGAYTHTSIAIMDALKILNIPIIEVHLSNIFKRESFRQTSYISLVCTGIISGFGKFSYLLALQYLLNKICDGNKK